MKTYVATKNAGKLAELRAIFAGSVLDLDVYPGYRDVSEDDASYLGNARLKALALRKQLHACGIDAAVLADDSGLEVSALGGRPGVHSARYGGSIDWPARRRLLMEEAASLRDRRARFVCAMVLVLPDGQTLSSLGTIDGTLVDRERGEAGFGYDPLFQATGADRTFAQLSEQEKNAISHRRRAADELLASLAPA